VLGLRVRLGSKHLSQFAVPRSRGRFTIGSDSNNDLVLRDGHVEAFACVMTRTAEIWSIEPFQGRLDGREITDPAKLRCGAHIELGDYTIVAFVRTARESIEQLLIDAIIAGDAASRLVYADWLEERSETARAELLRLQELLADIDATDSDRRTQFQGAVRRLGELASDIDPEWRLLVGRPRVELCRQSSARCAQDWGTLMPTGDPSVRCCRICSEHVYYANSCAEGNAHARAGRCFVIDLVELRGSRGSLKPP
jgi:uncharacterized protein (TIGR02996 family)